MAAEPTPLRPPAAPALVARNWRQAEAEAIWFARVEQGLALLAAQPHLSWADVADKFGCGESTLREWRRRYWESKARAS